MRGRLTIGVLATLVALMFGMGVTQYAYANDDPVSVGPKTFTGNQVQTQSQPETLRSDPTTALNARLIRLPEVSSASVKSQMAQDVGSPTKIGFPREVPELKTQQNTQTQLDWKPVPDGMVGSLAINSPGAAALRMGIRVQSLPDGAEVRFFSDKAAEITKVSGRTINELVQLNLKAGDPEETARLYWSPMIQGDVIGLEVFLPQGTSMDQVGITIPNLSHLVVDPSGSLDTVKALAGADSCNLDVMCYPEWLTTSNAVGQMVYSTGGNSFLCTGTLLNDQGSTGTPYFLTANHCISSQSTASTLQTYWFYHSSACNSGVPYSGIQTIPAGSTLLYNSSVTDTAFLRLNSQPPTGVTFAGWTTNTPIIGTPSTGLHNPQGDFQKSSFGSFAGFQSCIDNAQGFNCSPASEATGSFLQILYSQGITEGGSSGSGVFTNNGQYLYGQLKGGNLTCDNPSGSTTYGRFDIAYFQGNLGRWLKPSINENKLTLIINGSGRVISSPAGIDCTKNCEGSFESSQNVVLTPFEVDGNSLFTGWSGPCTAFTDDNGCIIEMSSARTVTANFSKFYFLRYTSSAGGEIISPMGLLCGVGCRLIKENTLVSVNYTQRYDYYFSGWTGDCSGTGACLFIMDSNKSVNATFTQSPEGTTSIFVGHSSLGGQPTMTQMGAITSSPLGIDCGNLCSNYFPTGTVLTVKAEPRIGWVFERWLTNNNGCSSNPCTFSLNSSTISGVDLFASWAWVGTKTLNIKVQGSGSVAQVDSPETCDADCTVELTGQKTYTYVATATNGNVFSGWSGDCSGTGDCTLTMNSNKTVTATFSYSPPSPNTFVLNVSKSGDGAITSTPPAINCGATCSASYNQGTGVTLTATPDSNYIFTGWAGDCSGTGGCTVTMSTNKNVTATFTSSAPPPLTSFNLAVSKTGAGTVSSQPAGIDCGAACSSAFGSGSTVELTAQPDNGFEFSEWSGACSGTATCSVLMDGDKAVSADFVEVPTYTVTVTKQSGGVVTSEPQGIYCGGSNKQCKGQFSAVQLTATPTAGFEFIKWVGCQNPEANVCSLQPTKKTTVKAVFKALPKYTLKVTKNKLGSITSEPPGLKCPDKKKVCSAKFTKGTQITLTPVPQEGRSFAGWTGACSGLDACTVVMDGGKGVGAMFQ